MRKLGRMVRRVLTAVSLLLLVAVLAAWVRGYWAGDRISIGREVQNGEAWSRTRLSIRWKSAEIGLAVGHLYTTNIDPTYRRLPNTWTWKAIVSEPASPPRQFYLEAYGPARTLNRHVWRWNRNGIVLIDHEDRLPFQTMGTEHPDVHLHVYMLAFPCWMAALVFGALPLWRGLVWWRSVQRRKRALLVGRCEACGYDLRASPERCPECGLAVEVKP